MELLKQTLQSYKDTIPNDSKTAAAISSGASIEDISVAATEDGLHELASALFTIQLEGGDSETAPMNVETSLVDDIRNILAEYRRHLPKGCETARLINEEASLEDISQSAQKEGLNDLVSILFEAEQEQLRG